MVDDKDKIEPEGVPPLEKRSMVSEDDLIERIKKVNRSEDENEIEELIPSKEVLLLFIAEKTHDINEKLGELLNVFRSAKVEEKGVNVEESIAPSVPETVSKPPTSRVDKIVSAFTKYGDDISIDTETSAQFVIIKPTKYLGGETFAKIGKDVRNFGGTYVSKGKDSFFQIPKMVKGEKQATLKTGKTSEAPAETLSNMDKVKVLFPKDLEDMLSFEEVGEYIVIKPRRYLGSENFAKIASVVRNAGGEYISSGKESHFRVPKSDK